MHLVSYFQPGSGGGPRLASVLAIVWTAVTPCPSVAAPVGGTADSIPLRALGGGLVAAPVDVRGETLWMLVDTGATRSRVRARVARRLDLAPRARYTVHSAVGAATVVCAGPERVRLGRSWTTIDCLGWSPGLDDAFVDLDVDGVLAADALTARPLLIDLVRCRLVVGATAGQIDGHEVPLTLADGRPAVTLGSEGMGGRPPALRLIVDSAADSLVLFGGAAEPLDLRRRARLTTILGSRPITIGAAPRLEGLPSPPREAVLLPEVTDRGEDGLLPLAATGAVFFDWEAGVAVLGARERRARAVRP